MTKKRTVRAAAVQIAPDLDSGDGTVSKVLAAIKEASEKGARLVVFPETFVPWYPYFSFVYPPVLTGTEHIRLYDNAVVVPGPVTEAVAAAARRNNIVVVLGVNERDHGSLYNTQLVFDVDGRLVLKRRKITPTFHERMIWGQGDGSGLTVVDTAVGRLGALACWQTGRLAFLIGALLMLANWPWTLLAILPTNKILMATDPRDAGPETRALLLKWNGLHAVRTVLGALATLAFIVAVNQ